MPGKVTPVVGYRMPGSAITFPVVRTGTATPEISQGSGTGLADFQSRRTGPGVIRWFDFTDDTVLNLNTSGYANFGAQYASSPPNPDVAHPIIDTAVKPPTGAGGSIRFDIPSLSGSDPCGAWYANFSSDLQTQFGENSDLYVQMRVRWNDAFANTLFWDWGFLPEHAGVSKTGFYVDATHFQLNGDQSALLTTPGYGRYYRSHNAGGTFTYGRIESHSFDGSNTALTVTPLGGAALDSTMTGADFGGYPQSGIKFFDVGAGDILGGTHPQYDGITHLFSSNDAKLVTITYNQHGAPMLYHYAQGTDGALQDTNLWQTGSGDFNFQNAVPDPPGCRYSTESSQNLTPHAAIAGCTNMVANEWVTLKLHMHLGPLTTQTVNGRTRKIWSNCRYRYWFAREGQPSQLLIDFTPSTPGYTPQIADDQWVPGSFQDVRIGKVWLFPGYLTIKDYTQVHDPVQVWIAEVIISSQDIPDPTVLPSYVPAPGTAANVSLNLMTDVAACPDLYSCSFCYTEGFPGLIDWCGAAYVEDAGALGSIVITGGGHSSYGGNEAYRFDFSTQRWSRVGNYNLNSINTGTTVDSYGEIASGIPASSHTYQCQQPFPSSIGGGSLGSLMLLAVRAAGYTGVFGGHHSHAMDLSTGQWTRASSNQMPDSGSQTVAAAFDTTRGVYWSIGSVGATVGKLDPQTQTWTSYNAGYGGGNNFDVNVCVAGYCASRDVLVVLHRTSVWEVWHLDCANPTGGWTRATTTGTAPAIPGCANPSINWAPLLGKFGVYDAQQHNFIYYLAPPLSLPGTWTWSSETFAGVSIAAAGQALQETYQRMLWIPKLRSWAWVGSVFAPVQLLRPLGT